MADNIRSVDIKIKVSDEFSQAIKQLAEQTNAIKKSFSELTTTFGGVSRSFAKTSTDAKQLGVDLAASNRAFDAYLKKIGNKPIGVNPFANVAKSVKDFGVNIAESNAAFNRYLTDISGKGKIGENPFTKTIEGAKNLGVNLSESNRAFDAYLKSLSRSQSIGDNPFIRVTSGAKQLGVNLSESDAAFNKYLASLQKGQQIGANPFDKAAKGANNLGVDLDASNKAFDTYLRLLQKGQQVGDPIFSNITENIIGMRYALLAVVGTLSFAIKDMIGTFTQFEYTMAKVRAVSNASSEQFDLLQTSVKYLGQTTILTSSEVAEGAKILAQAGFSAVESITLLEKSIQLAQATGQDLAKVIDISTTLMATFGLTTSDAGKAMDYLSGTANSTKTNILQLGEALKYVGPIASGSGLSMEEMLGTLGKLADVGLRGAIAGTTLRNVIGTLQDPTREEERLMKDLALRMGEVQFETKKADGSFIGMVGLLQQLEKAGVKADDAMRLFGKRGGPGMAQLLRIGSAGLQDMIDKFNTFEGATGRAAQVLDKTLFARFKELQSAIEALKISIGEETKGPIAAFTSSLTKMTRALVDVRSEFPTLTLALDNIIVPFTAVIALLGSLAVAWEFVGARIVAFIGQSTLVTTAMTAMSTGMGTLTISASALTLAIQGLTTAFVGFAGFMVGLWLQELFGFHQDIKSLKKETDDIKKDIAKGESEVEKKLIDVRHQTGLQIKDYKEYNDLVRRGVIEIDHAADSAGKITTIYRATNSEILKGTGLTQDQINEMRKSVKVAEQQLRVLKKEAELRNEIISSQGIIAKEDPELTKIKILQEEQRSQRIIYEQAVAYLEKMRVLREEDTEEYKRVLGVKIEAETALRKAFNETTQAVTDRTNSIIQANTEAVASQKEALAGQQESVAEFQKLQGKIDASKLLEIKRNTIIANQEAALAPLREKLRTTLSITEQIQLRSEIESIEIETAVKLLDLEKQRYELLRATAEVRVETRASELTEELEKSFDKVTYLYERGKIASEDYYNSQIKQVEDRYQIELSKIEERYKWESDELELIRLQSDASVLYTAKQRELLAIEQERWRTNIALKQTLSEMNDTAGNAEMRVAEANAQLTGRIEERFEVEENALLMSQLRERKALEDKIVSAELAADKEAALSRLATAQEKEQLALRAKQDKEYYTNRLEMASWATGAIGDILSGLYEASGEKLKAFFYLERAAAAAQAIINAEVAATKAGAQLGIFGLSQAALLRAQGYAAAGLIMGKALAGFATGGMIPGRSVNDRQDNIPIRATAGEFMIQRPAVRKYGARAMEYINKMMLPSNFFSGLNMPVAVSRPAGAFATGGMVSGSNGSTFSVTVPINITDEKATTISAKLQDGIEKTVLSILRKELR